MDEQKCLVDIQMSSGRTEMSIGHSNVHLSNGPNEMSVGHFAEVLDISLNYHRKWPQRPQKSSGKTQTVPHEIIVQRLSS